eukprot:TRINITY_DN3636_c0_g1_i1.p1 TRINITY_DN3636_c0_g1~~TRINITY_DN3636_c0_g1_i1.p1  ORF type:complete len:431 (+),score=101.25 TRINITY_DN3636_c0_g1_i1:376-1668(+)
MSEPTFGPQWLKEQTPTFTNPQDVSSDENGRSPRLMPRYTRSKSTPMLFEGQIGETRSDVFAMLKERNSFDKNFPTLNSKLTPPKPTTPPVAIPTSNAWKQSLEQSKPKEDAKEGKDEERKRSNSSNESDLHFEHLRDLIPNMQSSKVLRGRGDLLPTKKGSMALNKSIPPKFSSAMKSPPTFRKASSEPTLPLSPAFQEKYTKLLASRGGHPTSPGSRDGNSSQGSSQGSTPPQGNSPPATFILNGREDKARPASTVSRNDFFSGLLKEEQKKKKLESEQNENTQTKNENTQAKTTNNNVVAVSADSKPNVQATIAASTLAKSVANQNASTKVDPAAAGFSPTRVERSPPPTKHAEAAPQSPLSLASIEDEEKFLRGLGWVPEEESHVPELTAEEIAEVQRQNRAANRATSSPKFSTLSPQFSRRKNGA